MKLIALTQGKFAQVDDEDFEIINKYKWCAARMKDIWYTIRSDDYISMHRFIMNARKGKIINHKDGNGLNNQRNNLRFCNAYQRSAARRSAKGSSSIYLGVSWDKQRDRWKVRINSGNNKINIGYFKTEENAAIAYNIYAEKYHGEFARFNTVNT